MIQAVIKIDDRTNRVLNIVKAKFGLKDKSQAINLVVDEYEQKFLEPQLRPEYMKRLDSIINGKHMSRKQLEEAL